MCKANEAEIPVLWQVSSNNFLALPSLVHLEEDLQSG